MDLDRLVRRVSEQVAAQPSRRGIVTKVAKLAVGGGALFAGLRRGDVGAQQIGNCCVGDVCPRRNGRRRCPGKTTVGWTWYCDYFDGVRDVRYLCKDCSNKSGEEVCVVARKQ